MLLCAGSLVAVVLASPYFPAPELTCKRFFFGLCGLVCLDGCSAGIREVVGVDVYALVSSRPRPCATRVVDFARPRVCVRNGFFAL